MCRTDQLLVVGLAVGLLLGGWVPVVAQLQPTDTGVGLPQAGPQAPGFSPSQGAVRQQSPVARPPAQAYSSSPANSAVQPGLPPSPLSPTPAGSNALNPLPTTPLPTAGYGPVQPSYPGQAAVPTPGMTYVNPFASAQGTITQVPVTRNPLPHAPSVLSQRPFSGYSPPRALSPYINLFRRNDDLGLVNNYYSLVKPMLDQEAYNRQVQGEIRSLETATRLQQQSLNQLDQRTAPLYGAPSSGSYMDLRGYYPGLPSSSP